MVQGRIKDRTMKISIYGLKKWRKERTTHEQKKYR